MIDVLKDTDPDVRWAAALELGTIGAATEMQRHANDVRVVEPLIAALRDTDPRVRRAAAESLSKVGYESVAGLANALKDTDSNVRELAASALADLCIYGHCEPPYQRGVSALLAALRQRDLAVIAGAYKWFIRPGPGSKVALIEEIDKREPGSVDALIESLDKFGGQSMAEDLLTCCKNPKIEQAVVAWAPRHGLIVRSVR